MPWADRTCGLWTSPGRPMKGMVFIDPEGLHGDALREWADAAARHARGLPPKPCTPAAHKRR